MLDQAAKRPGQQRSGKNSAKTITNGMMQQLASRLTTSLAIGSRQLNDREPAKYCAMTQVIEGIASQEPIYWH